MRQVPEPAAYLLRTLKSGRVTQLFVRWYLTPSGIIYGLALLALLIALITAGASLVLTALAILLLSAFMPYKLWRERTITTNDSDKARSLIAVQARRLQALEQRLDELDRELKTTATATAGALRTHSEALMSLDVAERHNGEL